MLRIAERWEKVKKIQKFSKIQILSPPPPPLHPPILYSVSFFLNPILILWKEREKKTFLALCFQR
jgi:hypothetical protein